jgi:hypothetical protein
MSNKVPSPAPAPGGNRRLRLRERRADFSMLFREMHYCYGRLIGLEGIALWSWYRLHQHGGGKYEELTGYGWTGQPSILQTHGIKHHKTLRRMQDMLIQVGLLELRQAQDVFADAEIETLRGQARARGEKLHLQKGSHLAFVHDPLTRDDFVRWSQGAQCPTCPICNSCPAHQSWRAEQGMSNNDIPSVSNNDIPLPKGVSKNDTKPYRDNNTDNNHIDNVVAALTERGISKRIAARLAKEYPLELIAEKVELLDYLTEIGSPLIARNPAGYLRRAIEDDYAPPEGFQTRAEREVEQALGAQEEAKRAEILASRPRVLDFDARMAARYAVSDELQDLWKRTREALALQMTAAAYRSNIHAHAALVALEGDVARIAVDNRYTEDWLSHRLNETIEETLGRALGRAVRAEFFVPEAE